MKKSFKKIKMLVAVMFFLVTSSVSFAQWPTTFGNATITTTYCVSIDTAQPLQEFYKIDITAFNFSTEVDAQKVFGAISINRLTYKVDFVNQVAYLKIHADRTKDPQDVAWWNNYINSLCQN